jgi:HD-GYP domain-containing protein (c-di-GMP phosphodiesterase class II)
MEELSMSFSSPWKSATSTPRGIPGTFCTWAPSSARRLACRSDRKFRESLLLHIGKLGIPDRILLKESALNAEEWEIMRRHPEMGADLLGHFESYKEISSIILAHQEHYDGSGYPKGLAGEQIPIIARIIAIADAYHAMTSNRPYRKAINPADAAQELIRNRGTQFDPRLVDAFIQGLIRLRLVKPEELQQKAETA